MNETKGAVRAATKAYLGALVELHRAHVLTGGEAFIGQLPANALPHNRLPEVLIDLSHRYGLSAEDVRESAPSLIDEGHIAPGHLAQFATP